MKNSIYILLLAITFFISCDSRNKYDFQVDNTSQYTILVDFNTGDGDTIVIVQPQEKKLIYNNERLGDPVDYVGVEMSVFTYIKIMTQDSISANKDFYQREFWEFMINNNTSATYKLTLKDYDFLP